MINICRNAKCVRDTEYLRNTSRLRNHMLYSAQHIRYALYIFLYAADIDHYKS